MTKLVAVAIGSVLAGAGLIAIVTGGQPDEVPVARRVVVEARGFGFVPARVTVAPGDTIVFVNRDALPHTATATDSTWDSGELASGASWSLVAGDAGTTGYICAYHPSMRGSIDVR